MTSPDRTCHTGSRGWSDIGRAAERFARRVGRDAGKFAERIQEHAGDFAENVSRDWRRTHPSDHPDAAANVRGVFEELRRVLSDIVDGVDELIARAFPEPADTRWTRLVSNRDASCAGCARAIAAGEEAYGRRTATGIELRCVTCGAPSSADASAV